jgi:fructose-1,6-bisphosphatase/inositol monophosphatase family enzyme
MKDIDTQKIAALIRHVAATEVMPRFQNLQQADIREKSPGDFVTAADEAAEVVLTQLLQDALPGSLVVGEEAVSKDRAVLEKMKDDRPVWVIDPVDGTSNFAKGKPAFGILIALVQKGVTQYGWAFDVPGNRMAIAQRGAGAFLDGKKLSRTCKATDMKQLTGECDGAPQAHFDPVRPQFSRIFTPGCAQHDYMNYLTGDADFVCYVDRTTPWDHAANNLLAEEAGGYVAMDGDGRAYNPIDYRRAFLLLAPSKDWWAKIHPVLYPLHI